MIWYYTFGEYARGFSLPHTHLFHFVKDKDDFTFNGENPAVRSLQFVSWCTPTRGRILRGDYRITRGFYGHKMFPAPVLLCPTIPVLFESSWAFKEREGFHGCQMPEQLLGRIIRISSNPGDLVVDPFAGSGTTSRCQKLGRQYLGVELSRIMSLAFKLDWMDAKR